MTFRSQISSLRFGPAFLLLAAALLSAPPAFAQDRLEADAVRIPFDEWFREGDREDIPWKVHVSDTWLTHFQRQRVDLLVRVPGKPLQRRSVHRDLYLLVKLGNPSGRWFAGHGRGAALIESPLPKDYSVKFPMALLLRPGEYKLGVILYDRITGERSVTVRRVRVPLLHDDPLPGAGSELPVAEFMLPAQGPDNLFRPELRGRLNLPLATRRRIHIQVLANFSASEEYAGRDAIQFINHSILLPTINVLSQIQLSNGTLGLTALDLDRRQVIFEQADLRPLDWPRLREAVAALRTDVVDLRTLETRRERGAFFREVLQQKLAAAPATSPAAGEEPFRVFLIVGSGFLFPSGSDLEPVQASKNCSCRVYYMQYRVTYANLWDDLIRIIRPLEPKHFRVLTAMEMRRALATILAEIGSL